MDNQSGLVGKGGNYAAQKILRKICNGPHLRQKTISIWSFFALRSLCWRDTIFEHATNFLSFISTQREKGKRKKNHGMKLNFYTHLFLLCFKTINKIR